MPKLPPNLRITELLAQPNIDGPMVFIEDDDDFDDDDSFDDDSFDDDDDDDFEDDDEFSVE